MTSNHAEQSFSFGKISYEVSVDGNIDRPQALLDHMLATATAVTSVEVIQRGITTDDKRDDSRSKSAQKCTATATFGEITVKADIGFDSKQHISRRALNSLVFGAILPKIWETVGLYLGDNQPMTSPRAPLSPVLERDVLDHISRAMGLEQPLTSFTELSSQSTWSDQRTSPQPVGSR